MKRTGYECRRNAAKPSKPNLGYTIGFGDRKIGCLRFATWHRLNRAARRDRQGIRARRAGRCTTGGIAIDHDIERSTRNDAANGHRFHNAANTGVVNDETIGQASTGFDESQCIGEVDVIGRIGGDFDGAAHTGQCRTPCTSFVEGLVEVVIRIGEGATECGVVCQRAGKLQREGAFKVWLGSGDVVTIQQPFHPLLARREHVVRGHIDGGEVCRCLGECGLETFDGNIEVPLHKRSHALVDPCLEFEQQCLLGWCDFHFDRIASCHATSRTVAREPRLVRYPASIIK